MFMVLLQHMFKNCASQQKKFSIDQGCDYYRYMYPYPNNADFNQTAVYKHEAQLLLENCYNMVPVVCACELPIVL